MKKSGPDEIKLSKKKKRQNSRCTFHWGTSRVSSCGILSSRTARLVSHSGERRLRCRQKDWNLMTLYDWQVLSSGSDPVGERVFLVVLWGVTRNAAKPISAACWYRMNAAGSTSPWSLSFHSPSPLVPSFFLSLSLSRSLCCLRTPTLLLCLSNQRLPLSLCFSRSLLLAALSLEREPLDGRTKAAGCFSPLLLFCLSVRLSSVAPLALFSSLSFSHSFPSSRAVAGSLVSSVHRPGLFVFFSLIIPLRAIVRVN